MLIFNLKANYLDTYEIQETSLKHKQRASAIPRSTV